DGAAGTGQAFRKRLRMFRKRFGPDAADAGRVRFWRAPPRRREQGAKRSPPAEGARGQCVGLHAALHHSPDRLLRVAVAVQVTPAGPRNASIKDTIFRFVEEDGDHPGTGPAPVT